MKVNLHTSFYLCAVICTTLASKEFILLHNNDMHGRFEQVSKTSGICWPELAEKNLCYGGFARVSTIIQKYRNETKENGIPTLYLNAGDTFTGTIWFTVFRAKIAADFMNALSPDAMCLGNHEFIDGEKGLQEFLEDVNFPVVSANTKFEWWTPLRNISWLTPSRIVEINGTKMGIIGVVTPQTRFLSLIKLVNFQDEVEAINEEAERLVAQGINIIIALVHSGFATDKRIAEHCPEVDIVVGGHTNTFLYNNDTAPDGHPERVEGMYPTVVTQKSGKQVYVVQAAAFTKYMGKALVKFDDNGNVLSFEGKPILLDSSIPQDPKILDLLEKYRPNITTFEKEVLASCKVTLEGGKICRKRECITGNLLTEAMVYNRVKTKSKTSDDYWTDASIAFYNGGGIRSPIEYQESITKSNVFTGLPFGSMIVMLNVTGQTILDALEHSAEVYTSSAAGGFLQMYGVKVTYNMNNTVGNRVEEVKVLCTKCKIPKFENLDINKKYAILITDFLYLGGDKYVFQEKRIGNTLELGVSDAEALTVFIKDRNIIYPTLDGRIAFKSAAISLQFNCLMIVITFICLQFQ